MAKKHTFQPVDPKATFPEIEEKILKFWKENKIFEKSVESRPQNKPWTFLDGPPFVTGMPHYGSLLSSLPKDVFGRYWTMKGYRVRRVWGWDGHGLPIENKVENALKIKRKRDIEEIVGVKKFIEECKKYVNDVSVEWEWYVDHIGRWVDFKNAYKTWDFNYMESVMWVFKQLYEKGLVYKGLRVSLYCPHCATPISNFEVAMDTENYKDVTEPATTYKYQLKNEPNTYLLAWSTTPWNKIVTPALAINPKLEYVKVKQGNEFYILAKSTLKMLHPEPKYKIIETFRGSDLVGKEFVLHYDFYPVEPGKKRGIVIGGDFVTAEEGTGIVTLAVYGEEDLDVMQREQIQLVFHVDEEGIVKENVPKFAGMYYLKANKAVNADLQSRNLIYRDDSYTHSVAHCWRCGTRLFFNPQNAWYVNVQTLKKRMERTNESVNWFPQHFKMGRFLKSMEHAPDWNISRNRYWGSPVPVWECICGERFVPGSVAELEAAFGSKINDLHKPEIDEVTITCKKCGKKASRTPEVLDSWIEAGSASFAERHFPISQQKLEDFFPPDFIAEYTGQIRAWFYVLHVIGTALYDSPAFKNVLVEGVILGTDGRKMSKNFKNYPDPKEMLTKFGGDALRLYLLGSPVMQGEDIRISETEYRDQVRGLLLIFWNVYNFFVTYATIDSWQPTAASDTFKPASVLDQWVLSRLNNTIKTITQGFENYDTPKVVEAAWEFINRDVSTWYVRRIRDRVGPAVVDSGDKQDAYQTLYTVLTSYCVILAPLIPFTTEEIYKNLTGAESVHLVNWLKTNKVYIHSELEKEMRSAQELASIAHAFRKQYSVKVRVPFKKLTYQGPNALPFEIEQIVKDEINVYELIYRGKITQAQSNAQWVIGGQTDELNQDLEAGKVRELIRKIQQLRKEKACRLDQKIVIILPKDLQSLPKSLLSTLKQETLADSLQWGTELSISTG